MMKTRTRTFPAAFTLVEIMIVTVIIGILAGLTAYGLRNAFLAARITEEKTKLEVLGAEVQRSFHAMDYTNNVACIAGYPIQVGGTDASVLTTFGSPAGTWQSWSVPVNSWAGKLSRRRGDLLSASGGNYVATKTSNAPLYDLVTNWFRQPRMLFAGPVTETQQRYLLISLVAPPERNLVIPAPPADPTAYAQWFDAIWSTIWDGNQPPPALWGSLLSASDYNNWTNGSESGTSNTSRLVVVKITQDKWPLILNNNVLNADAQVTVQGATSPILQVSGLSNVVSTISVPFGRYAYAYARPTGSSGAWAQIQIQHVTSEGTTFTVQTGP